MTIDITTALYAFVAFASVGFMVGWPFGALAERRRRAAVDEVRAQRVDRYGGVR